MRTLNAPRPALLLLALTLLARGSAQASEVSDTLEKVARELTGNYLRDSPDAKADSLAVLTFSSNEALSKRRVGFAVSEILTHKLVRLRAFTVVERTHVEEVLGEQRFQMTGAVDAGSAARVGKMLGARLLILGSVERTGPTYGVNARLVRTETSEVLATTYEELPATAFEKEARPYLALVPERQTLGLYLLYNYRTDANDHGSFQSGNAVGGTYTVSPRSFSLGLIGGGIRYSPFRDWMVDANIAVLAGIAKPAEIQPAGNSPSSRNIDSGKVMLTRATLNWTGARYGALRGILGMGASGYRVLPYGTDFPTAVVPGIRGGVEYRPQARLGLGLILNYDLLSHRGMDSGTKLPVVELSGFSVEPTLALYF